MASYDVRLVSEGFRLDYFQGKASELREWLV